MALGALDTHRAHAAFPTLHPKLTAAAQPHTPCCESDSSVRGEICTFKPHLWGEHTFSTGVQRNLIYTV